MRFHDGFHQAQPEPKAPLGAAGVATKQSIPDARELIRGNAGACVADAQERATAFTCDLDVDATARRRVFHRVVDQVRGHLFEPRAIAGHDNGVTGRDGQTDALRLGDVAIQIDRAIDDLV